MLAWLAVSSSPQDERFANLRQLVRSGEIGYVADADAALFQTLVQEAVAIAGISGNPIVNGEPVKGKLHFYLTDPKAAGFTHCVAGNAVYDADLDSIFVDRSLFNPAELGKVGQALHWERWARKRFAFTYTFTMLIVLHELGHRQLHRFQRGMFDTAVSADGRTRENEADRFAATVLRQAYISGRVTTNPDVLAELVEAGVAEQLNPEQQLVASVLYAAAQMSVGLLFSRGTYSSLYEDRSHPLFGDRIRRISDVFADLAGNDSTLAGHLQYFRSVTGRVGSLRSLGLVELNIDAPLAGLQFDDDGLVIIDRSWLAYRLPYDRLTRSGTRISVRPTLLGSIGELGNDTLLDRIWSVSGEGTFVAAKDTVFQIGKDRISTRPDIAGLLSPSRHPVTLGSTEPADSHLIETDEGLLVTDHGSSFLVKWSDLMGQAVRSGKISDPSRGSFFLIDHILYIYMHERDGSIAGALDFDLREPSLARYKSFQLTADIDAYGRPIPILLDGAIHHLLIGKTDLNSKVFVWELFGNRPPELRSDYTPLLDELSAQPFSGQNVPVIVNRVRSDSSNGVFVILPGDSIIHYDPSIPATLQPVFHPGTSVNVNTSTHGLVAFSAFNGYKAFVLRLEGGRK
ncbi:hypothetical protein J2R96_005909 [Bradyrhizobium elkanii]|nr:hypothetical protein [Bradyrhizobium elkanii]